MSKPARTAAAGWHVSRYNVWAAVPGTDKVAVANLLRGTLSELGVLERALLTMLDDLPDTQS